MPTSIDRRDKMRHRDAIVRAARSLIDERGGPLFSVDELAGRADVARRTVFNHFASIDEVLLTLCGEALEIVIDDFLSDMSSAPLGDGTRAFAFDRIAQSLRSTDLPSAIAAVVGILGPQRDRSKALSDQAFARVGERLVAEVERRNPGQDLLDAQLLVSSLMGGVVVISQRWVSEYWTPTGVRLDDTARADWQRLMTRLIGSVRTGYTPDP